MKNETYVVGIYALLLAIGGVIGFLKAASMASLLMGVFSGIILGILAWSMEKNRISWAHAAAATVTALILCFFAYRAVMTQKLMPAIVAGVSLIVFFYLAKGLRCCQKTS